MTDEGSYYFPMKRDDLKPPLQVKAFNPDGSARDLTDNIITFTMKDELGATKVANQEVFKVLATSGVMEYRWQEGDTDTAGLFRGEFEIDGVDSYPKETWITIEIFEDLN